MSSFSREWATRAELERVDALVGEARARSGRAASTSAARARARGGDGRRAVARKSSVRHRGVRGVVHATAASRAGASGGGGV